MHALETDGVANPIKVLLVEDHAVFRQALSLLLYRSQQMEVTQAGTLAEARLLLGGVDVVALDNALPDGDGVELIGDVRSHNPDASVLILGDAADSATSKSAIEAGADAVLSKVESPFTIIDEIKVLGDGGSVPHRRAKP